MSLLDVMSGVMSFEVVVCVDGDNVGSSGRTMQCYRCNAERMMIGAGNENNQRNKKHDNQDKDNELTG